MKRGGGGRWPLREKKKAKRGSIRSEKEDRRGSCIEQKHEHNVEKEYLEFEGGKKKGHECATKEGTQQNSRLRPEGEKEGKSLLALQGKKGAVVEEKACDEKT